MTTARFTFDELLTATGGHPAGKRTPFEPARISTDSRTLRPGSGDFFLPIAGENFDGHAYLAAVFDQGAAGAFAQKDRLAKNPDWANLPNLIVVDDTTQAYLAVARHHRRRMKARIVALTGSSGKTTTKEMLFRAFSEAARTQCTQKNFNNEIGVSQTLLSLQPDTDILIVEMGMRGLGEIGLLSRCAEPDLALVINVGPAHIGRLGSLENIAQAKCEIFEGLNPDTGIGLVNGDDALLLDTARRVWHRQGMKGELDTYSLKEARNISTTPTGGMRFEYGKQAVELALPGEHMVSNALAVLKTGELLGLATDKLAQGLCAFQPAEGRWHREPLTGFENVWIIDDAYNANPASMKASLAAFLGQDAAGLKRFLVIGGMKELGDDAPEYHKALGEWLGTLGGIDGLFTVGEEGPWIAEAAREKADFPVVHLAGSDDHALNAQSLIESLQRLNCPLKDALLFLKGSRAYRLEKLAEGLRPFAPLRS